MASIFHSTYVIKRNINVAYINTMTDNIPSSPEYLAPLVKMSQSGYEKLAKSEIFEKSYPLIEIHTYSPTL